MVMVCCITRNSLRIAQRIPVVNSPKRRSTRSQPPNGPIIVYSAYEQTRLKELAAEYPDLGEPIGALTGRLADLLPIVRGAVYFPELGFSKSIKSVAPGLCPGFSYEDLDSVAASSAFLQLASGSLRAPKELDDLRRQRLAYCEGDMIAMVEVHKALMRLTVQNQGYGSGPGVSLL